MDIEEIVRKALEEDIGSGDITTDAVLRCNERFGGKVIAVIIARAPGILCGIDIARMVFNILDNNLGFDASKDGVKLSTNQRVVCIKGSVSSILTGERVALNFLSHLSGIATVTQEFVEEVRGTGVRLLDTRKTIPLLRELEKYAVKIGGAENHRFGLYDAILIKENHLKIVGGIENLNIDEPFEIEVKNLNEFKTALKLSNVKRIMLDNMDIDNIKECVILGKGLVEIEVSGGVTIQNVKEMAETGVQYISIGAITHSAPSFDFSLIIE